MGDLTQIVLEARPFVQQCRVGVIAHDAGIGKCFADRFAWRRHARGFDLPTNRYVLSGAGMYDMRIRSWVLLLCGRRARGK